MEAPRPRAAILPLAVEGELSEVDRKALTAELVEGLRRGAFDIVEPDAVVAEAPTAGSCGDSGCFQEIAKQTGATHIVRARVRVVDRDYDVRVELADGKSGSTMATSEEGCEICGIQDAGSLVNSAAATLRTKLDALAKGPASLGVRSEPADAEVRIDGQAMGVTPLQMPVIPGKRIIRVTKEGYIAVEREVTVVEGMAEEISFSLQKLPSRLPKRPWGFVALGLGIAGVGVATTFAVFDDRPYQLGGACSGSNKDALGRCRRLWDTEWIAFGTALAAATLVTLGVAVLLTSSRRKRDARKQKARVGIGPGSLVVSGRF